MATTKTGIRFSLLLVSLVLLALGLGIFLVVNGIAKAGLSEEMGSGEFWDLKINNHGHFVLKLDMGSFGQTGIKCSKRGCVVKNWDILGHKACGESSNNSCNSSWIILCNGGSSQINNQNKNSFNAGDAVKNGTSIVVHVSPLIIPSNGRNSLDGNSAGSAQIYNTTSKSLNISGCGSNLCSTNKIPPFFIFGDPLLDSGNNNYLVSVAKADMVPNGIDFIPNGGHPTGRFSNGKTVTDLIADEMGAKSYPPPYLSPGSKKVAATLGVNYASGGGGILNATGSIFIGRLNMDAQLDSFAKTRQYLISRFGVNKALELLKNSWFPISMGSNDFLGNYLIPVVGSRILISQEKFINFVITKYRRQLTRLHSLGARKISVSNIGPIGCIPFQREVNPRAGSKCVLRSNQIVEAFNKQLKYLIIELNTELPGAKFVHMNNYHIVSDLLQNYADYGFEVIDSSCCKTYGRFGGVAPCGLQSTYCPNRSKYFFWDPFHPSEAVSSLIAKRLLDGNSEEIFPLNLRQVIQL
ncbi:hypothetical protein GIB67_007487 [Kingdonia uniflora]|uniref:Uncharacterized protein n=1 Tax=Kingdonia uniflora TaxID=39325 RepID=A0A7J7LVU8_9MAGN|nr:hypothetical protein GIB67_007487 [Kingdonia uniflora]